MKIQYLAGIEKIAFGLLLVLLHISGCSSVSLPPEAVSHIASSATYRSELVDPEAKALFAFSEFRILGAENHWEEAIEALTRAISFDPQSDYLQLILAKAYLHQQQPEQAVAALKILLARDSKSVAGHELLGDVLSHQQNYTLAIEHFRQALQQEPDHGALQLRLAMALTRLNRNDEATSVLEALLKQHPEAVLAQLALARLYLENEQAGKASATYQRLLKQQPDHLQAALDYGKLLEQQNPDAAFELYQSFIIQNPRAAGVRQQLGQYFLDKHNLEDALVQFKAVWQQYPKNQHVLNRIGLIQLDLENWIEAEGAFRLQLEQDSHQDGVRYYLAMALLGQEKSADATTVLEAVGNDSSLYADARLQLAYLYKQSGQDERAIEILRQMIEEGIQRPELYYYLVVFLGDREDFEEAIKVALAGVEKYPDATQLLYQLGIIYEKHDKRQAAVQTMENILLLDDAHSDALNFLAYHQAEKEIDLPLALSRAERALAINPSGYIVDTLGWIYFKMGRYSESREQLEEATDLHPDDAVIQEHLGDLYRAMNLWEKAAAAYQRALELDPQAQQIEEKLKKMLGEEH